MGQHHDNDAGAVGAVGAVDQRLRESGGRQRRRRSPGSADRAAVSRSETGDHLGEPVVRFERVGKAEQSPSRP